MTFSYIQVTYGSSYLNFSLCNNHGGIINVSTNIQNIHKLQKGMERKFNVPKCLLNYLSLKMAQSNYKDNYHKQVNALNLMICQLISG